MRLRTYFTLGILLLPFAGVHAAVFVADDRLVSDPSVDMVDPEFDIVGNRIIWQDDPGGWMWLAGINPQTGDIIPSTGRGVLIDTSLANLIAAGNGPEFGFGAGEVFICYTKQIGTTRSLAVARKDPISGNWVPKLQDYSNNRWRPICTPPGTPDTGRMAYIRQFPTGTKAVSWRVIDDAITEHTYTNIGSAGGRWVEGERAFLSAGIVGGVTQLYWVDIDAETATQITFDTDYKYNTFAWYAPEYDEVLISVAVNFTHVGIYRRIGGVWTRIHTFQLPSSFGYVSSPEPFIHNGKSYIAVVAAKALGAGPLKYVPAGASEVWIANIDPDAPFYRRIDNGIRGVRRSEPEPFNLNGGPAIYYTETDPASGNALLRIADTGLGSTTAGDSDGDGISDDRDNCTQVANPSQTDTDVDGIGNFCDPDFNNDCLVDLTDFVVLNSLIGTSTAYADLNGDGTVTWADYSVMQPYMFMPPGPASLPYACDGT